MQPLDLNEARDATAIVNDQLEPNRVEVCELDLDLPLTRGNGDQLQQVPMNLMINAQQAMGGAGGQITVTTRSVDPGTIEVVVSVHGPGIPKEVQGKLFEPFFTTKPTGKGTGPGLSVSFGIAKDQGGDHRGVGAGTGPCSFSPSRP